MAQLSSTFYSPKGTPKGTSVKTLVFLSSFFSANTKHLLVISFAIKNIVLISLSLLFSFALLIQSLSPTHTFVAMSNQLDAPALGSPNPYDVSNIERGNDMLQHLHVGERPPLSPAMLTIFVLTLLYYTLQLIPLYYKICQSDTVQRQPSVLLRQSQASTSQNMILMLAFLVMLVRMRLRIDLEQSEPSEYVTTTYYAVVVASYLQAFAGDVLFCSDSTRIVKLRRFIQILCTTAVYVCVIVLFTILINQGKTKNAHISV